jgi:hypothetical protein
MCAVQCVSRPKGAGGAVDVHQHRHHFSSIESPPHDRTCNALLLSGGDQVRLPAYKTTETRPKNASVLVDVNSLAANC